MTHGKAAQDDLMRGAIVAASSPASSIRIRATSYCGHDGIVPRWRCGKSRAVASNDRPPRSAGRRVRSPCAYGERGKRSINAVVKPPANASIRKDVHGSKAAPQSESTRGLLVSDPDGATEAFMHGHGFSLRTLVALVRARLATIKRESVNAGGERVVGTRIKITDAGRKALKG
jgi:hypothetical protein